MMHILLNSLFIFCLRVMDVSLGTIRTVMITRGLRMWAALVGFVEITIWVVAISKVIGHLTHFGYIIGYSGGFATGTLMGMSIVSWLSLGHVNVRVVSGTKGQVIAQEIRKSGCGATLTRAEGHAGTVYLVDIVVTRKHLENVLRTIRIVDQKAFVTVEEAPQVIGGYQRLSK